jgi:CRP/FNR family transcriptional regulator
MINPLQIQKILKLFPVLEALGEPERQAIFAAGQIVNLPQGQMLLQPDQQCQFIPLVLSGQLRVFKLSASGREMTLFRTGPGETCLMSIACRIKNQDFPAQAQVEEPTSLFMLPQSAYQEVLDRSSAWKDFLILTLYEHLSETMETLEAVAFDRTDRRLAAWLLEKTGGGASQVVATHEAIAIELGTVREVVSRLLGEFRNKGAVALGRGRINILDPAFFQAVLTAGNQSFRC